MPDIKLKPCPFCGGKARGFSHCSINYIKCMTCRTVSGIYDTYKDAVAAWNRRADDEMSDQV